MGVFKDIVSKVKEEVGPLASVVKEEMANQVEKVVDRVLASPMMQPAAAGGAQDEWAFKPMARAEESNGAEPRASAGPRVESETAAAPSEAQAATSPSVSSAPAASAPAEAASAAASPTAAASSPVEQAAPAAGPVRITAHPSPTDPATCKFTVEVPVFEEHLIRIKSREQAELSPLARRIFDIPQVKTVTFAGNIVTVTKQGPEPWPVIARQVGPAIRAFLASGETAILPGFQSESSAADKDDSLAFRVQQVIETMINPGVAGHGGYVTLLGVKSEIAYIKMGGGCQGCGAADLTLKQGIVTTIKAHVPEIQEVLDSTDHAAGENPFYKGSP